MHSNVSCKFYVSARLANTKSVSKVYVYKPNFIVYFVIETIYLTTLFLFYALHLHNSAKYLNIFATYRRICRRLLERLKLFNWWKFRHEIVA